MHKQELIGTWRLLDIEFRSASGTMTHPAGDEPVGMLLYEADGYVAMVYMLRGRPRFAAGDPTGGTPAEIKAAFEGFDAYCGTYTFDERRGVVTHHVLSSRFPNWEGTDQARQVELVGDRLRLVTTQPILVQGTEWTISVAWERAGAGPG